MNKLLNNLIFLIFTPLLISTGCTAITIPEAREIAAGILQVPADTLVEYINLENHWYGFSTADGKRDVGIRKTNGEFCSYYNQFVDEADKAMAEDGTQPALGSVELASIAMQEITSRRPSFNPAYYDLHQKGASFDYVRRLSPTVVHARDFVDIRLNSR